MRSEERVLRAPDQAESGGQPDRQPRRAVRAVEVVVLGYVSAPGSPRDVESELAPQVARIDQFCIRRGWDLLAVVRDLEAGRKRPGRPSLTHAIDRLRRGAASCLVVAELRRLAPSVAELGGVIEAVDQAGGRLVSLDPAIDSATKAGQETLRVISAVSEWERTRRAEITTAARAKKTIPTIEPKLKRRIVRMRGAGMTLQAIADTLNEEEVPTVRGGAEWRPSSVQAAVGYKRPELWS
jgi:DNA invertase Pin-like site-specific DNA recombinase